MDSRQNSRNDALLDFFRARVKCMTESTAVNYNKALNCLSSYISDNSVSADVATAQFLENWFLYMQIRGLRLNTCLHYIDVVSGLYSSAVDEGVAPSADVFATVKARIKLLPSDFHKYMVSGQSFSRLVNVLKISSIRTDDTGLAINLLLMSLLNDGMSLTEVALLKKGDERVQWGECKAIAERYVDSRRQFLFPLGQSGKTRRQLTVAVNKMVSSLLDTYNIEHSDNLQNSIRSYWAYAALRCGVDGETIVGMLGCRPAGMPILNVVSGQECPTDESVARVRELVASQLVSNPINWYAMRLRPRVKFKDLTQRLSLIGGRFSKTELFYPCDEIARRVNKKVVVRERPVMPDVVFFKSQVTDIPALFSRIGDMAWCYSFGGQYAVISKSAMALFQQAIGKFSPDYEVGPVGSIALQEGDRVEVLSGPFKGFDGSVVKETYDKAGVVYRIKIFNDASMNIEWRISDSRFVKKYDSVS